MRAVIILVPDHTAVLISLSLLHVTDIEKEASLINQGISASYPFGAKGIRSSKDRPILCNLFREPGRSILGLPPTKYQTLERDSRAASRDRLLHGRFSWPIDIGPL